MGTKKKPPLDIDECIEASIKDGTLSKKEAGLLREYAAGAGEAYWEMHWMDIEEQNGMEPEEAEAFARFYNKYKENEVQQQEFKWILFDCSLYT
jgi:hypothetical protein